MAVQLKQRLIGAVVLLALAVLALPLLLDRTSSRVTQLQSQIPSPGQPIKPVVPKVVTEAAPVKPEAQPEPEPQSVLAVQDPLDVPQPPEVTEPKPVTEPKLTEVKPATTPVATTKLTETKIKPVDIKPESKPEVKVEPKPVVVKPGPATTKTEPPKVKDDKLSDQARQALAMFSDDAQLSGSAAGTVVKVIPKKTASAKQSAWVVQLAGFKNSVNAEKLVTQLQRKGYRAFVDTSMPGLARVMVGPETDRSRLDSQVPRIEQDTSLKGMVRPYTP